MQETFHGQTTTISTSGRPICNLHFTDDIDLMVGSNSELQELPNKLVATASTYGMEISTVKSKVMVNSTNNASVSIIMDGEKLEEVSSFKYLGATLTKDGTCKTEIHIWIATATAAMARLTRVWKSNISFQTNFKLYKSLVISILLYWCETWTLLTETERRIQVFENKCLKKLLCICYWEHNTNEYVWNEAESLMGQQEPLLSTVKWWKLAWFGHVTWHDGLWKTVMQGIIKGGCRWGQQCKTWLDNVKVWMDMSALQLLTATTDTASWSRLSAYAPALRFPQQLNQSREWHDMTWQQAICFSTK